MSHPVSHPSMRVLQTLLFWALACSAACADSSLLCGSLTTAYGPFDYRVDVGPKLKVVEDNHFTPRVEALAGGITGSIGSDIDYTLRAFPNHHRALVAMMNLGARLKSEQPTGAQWTIECYFRRALTFRADDHIARMLYVKFLTDKGRQPEALQHLEVVTCNAGDAAATHFNAGLLYADLGEYGRALVQAHRASALGFPGVALRERLKSAGKWAEPVAATGEIAPAASQPTRC